MELPKYSRDPIRTRNLSFHKAYWNLFFATRWYYLTEDYHYRMPTGEDVMLHAGFRWNGASVPRPFSYILHPVGVLLIPGLIHDYIFKYACLHDESEKVVKEFNRRSADQAFLEICTITNGLRGLNFILIIILSLFSKRAWNKCRDNNHEKQTKSK